MFQIIYKIYNFHKTCLLFTSSEGDRRFRCHNYHINLGKSLEEIYDEIDEKTVSCFIIRKGLWKIYQKQKLENCKTMMINTCKEIFQDKLRLKIVRFMILLIKKFILSKG